MYSVSGVSVVILARNYNPSIISKEWLSEKGIITEPIQNFIHTPVFSLIESERFSLTVDENRLQVSVKGAGLSNLEALSQLAEKFVNYLPETPYTAIGFNLHYRVPNESYHSEKLFHPNEQYLAKLFNQWYQLGASFVFSFGEFVARLNISPPATENQPVVVDFNFHSDAHGVQAVRQKLSQYLDVRKRATTIIEELSSNG